MNEISFSDAPAGGLPFFRLADGRLWSVADARFIDAAPEGAEINVLSRAEGPADAAYLKRTLEHYDYPVGPELMTLEEAKAAKLAEINAACDAALAALIADYPESELLTFDKQEAEARALLADPEAATPFLTPLAAARGLETKELARKVIAKADAFTTASGHVIGLRQKDEDRLTAAQTVEDVAAIVPDYRLPEAG